MSRPGRRDLHWTPEEDVLLRELARTGETVANIAKRMNRSPGSVSSYALRQNIALAKARNRKGK